MKTSLLFQLLKGWSPDPRKAERRLTAAMLVKF
jgi:hypothetical protein